MGSPGGSTHMLLRYVGWPDKESVDFVDACVSKPHNYTAGPQGSGCSVS